MKKLLICFFATYSISAYSAYIDSIDVSPLQASPVDEIIINVSGDLANPSYFLSSTNLTLSGNTYIFDIFSDTTGGIAPQVLVPFDVSTGLGMLSSGSYNFVANGYIGNRLTSTLSTSFNVSSVPLPATLWLFISGLAALVGAKVWARFTPRSLALR